MPTVQMGWRSYYFYALKSKLWGEMMLVLADYLKHKFLSLATQDIIWKLDIY